MHQCNTQIDKDDLVTPVFSQNELGNENFSNRTDILRQKKKSSSKHDDNQRGGIDDLKNFSFNPKLQVDDMNALVPFENKVIQYLENLLPKTPESELAKEVVHNAHYKQVQMIIKRGRYNFDNPKEFNIDKLRKQSGQIESKMFTEYLPKEYQTHTSLISHLDAGHNVETYLLYKQLKAKEKKYGALEPISEGE